MKTQKRDLLNLNRYLEGLNLTVYTHSPGEGVTRYKFVEDAGPDQCFFGPKSGCYTSLGIRHAWSYANGRHDQFFYPAFKAVAQR